MITRNKKILFVGELPPKSIHGISTCNFININQLKEKFEVDIVEEVYLASAHEKFSIKKVISLISRICRIFLISLFTNYSFFYTIQSVSFFGNVKTFLQIFAFKLCNKGKVVLHLHRSDFHILLENKVSYYLFKFNLKKSYRIVVLSNEIKSMICKMYPNLENRISVLDNTSDLEEEINKYDGKNINTKFRFVFFSNYIKEKGILEAIEAFESLSKNHENIELCCYGSFVDVNIRDYLLSLKVTNIIINDVVIDKKAKTDIFFKADCLLLPSYNEGKPVVLLEAMACKLPIIATNVGFIAELMPKDYNYLYNSSDNNLQLLMEKMLSDDRLALGEILFSQYNNYYSNHIHRQQLFKIFE